MKCEVKVQTNRQDLLETARASEVEQRVVRQTKVKVLGHGQDTTVARIGFVDEDLCLENDEAW